MNKNIERLSAELENQDPVQSFWVSIGRYLLLTGILATFIFIITTKIPLVRYFFEEDAPEIEIQNAPKGLGVRPRKIKILVKDPHSGVELVRARVEQSRISKILLEETPPLNTKEYDTEIELDASSLGLRRGVARIAIEAFDRSLESNGSKTFIDLPVRFDTPGIEILSAQHNGEKTGMEFVLYRLRSDEISESGMQVGKHYFEGFPASAFDPDISGIADIFVGFYAMPRDIDTKNDKVVAYAINEVGNRGEQTFYYRIRDRKTRTWEYKIGEIRESFEQIQATVSAKLSETVAVPKKLWTTHIPKPIGKESSPRVGDDIRLIDLKGHERTFQNQFISFRTMEDQEVRVTAPGIITLSGWIDSSGSWTEKKPASDALSTGVMAIDHGMGLVSVFAGLKDILSLMGTEVTENSLVGIAGILPHMNEHGYFYGLYLQGQAVRPEEWWDKIWVNDHIIKKVNDLKTRYNVRGVQVELPEEDPNKNESNTGEAPLPEIIRTIEDLRPKSDHIQAPIREYIKPGSLPPVNQNTTQPGTVRDF